MLVGRRGADMTQFEDLQLQIPKVSYDLVSTKMLNTIDECNELKCKIWEIEMKRSVEECRRV